ncbi:mitochondrial fission factor homolog B isoform X1 [Brienomyrus brachyistius]|uniref:mitochondrial fission factor homolog B isoform X1 n=1 Tax=Brienomyrus brachyistius TaxID=42636 RepID=UPI0020B3BBFD|nr:mitochondrial fission factor homolog B isoform X1 [Brienomyrus brachyistius]
MNGAAFPSPTAEIAEINRIHYELEYTEGISQRMRIPEKLKVASSVSGDEEGGFSQAPHSALMQVPERIVVADDEGSQYSRPRDLDLIQSTPLDSLALKTPPRVLTLNDRPLDFLEMERTAAPVMQVEEVRGQGRLRRERSTSENTAMRYSGQLSKTDSIVTPTASHTTCPLPSSPDDGYNLYSTRGILSLIQSTTRRAYQQVLEVLDENHCSKPVLRGGSATSNPQHDSRFSLSTLDSTLEGAPDDMALVDAASLRRQIIKLNRRLQLLEEENKERMKREMIMYSVTVAFWLVNSWIWLRR